MSMRLLTNGMYYVYTRVLTPLSVLFIQSFEQNRVGIGVLRVKTGWLTKMAARAAFLAVVPSVKPKAHSASFKQSVHYFRVILITITGQ